MSKKIPIGVALALILVAVALTVAVTVGVYLNMYNDLIQDLPQRAQQYSKLTDIDELVRSRYYGDINYDELDANIAEGYINGIGDPYSVYIGPDDYDLYNNAMQGKLPGIGIKADYDMESGYMLISSVEMNSPAYDAGLMNNYYVTSVNGINVTERNFESLYNNLTMSLEKTVRLSYITDISDGKSQPVEVELKNGYSEQTCTYSVNGNVGYIRLGSVYSDTPAQFADAVSKLSEKSVTGIILDLRNCASLHLDAAAQIIDMIVPLGSEGTGAIYTAKNAEGETVKVYSSDSNAVSLKFAVLINDRTECAAELIACDLKDFGKAVLIGETTAGHGKMQEMFRLDDGGAVLLSVAEIYPYVSDSFDGVGIEPDVSILTNDLFKNQIGIGELSEDEQYKNAYSYLSGQ